MLKTKFSILFLLFFAFNGQAQKLNLGKVTKSELIEKSYPLDTSASAAIIFKKAKTDFIYTEDNGFITQTTFQIKLKIYKKEGLKWANFKIPYYIGYKTLQDEIVNIESANTYNLENDKIVKSKATGESKFREQINENWEAKMITFPNVREGSVIELEYVFKSQNISTLPDFQYQYEIPVNYVEFQTNIPAFFVYNGIRKGYFDMKMEQKVESTSQSFDEKVNFTKVARKLEYNQVVYKYTASNIPALKEEDFVNNINNYYGQLMHELRLIQYPNEKPKQIATTWESVAQSVYENVDFKEAVSKFDYFSSDVKSLIDGVPSSQEKVKKIFNFVKNRMNWNGRFGYYPQNKMENVYENKVGNVAEINLILLSMLRMAGVDANPVLLSTRENGDVPFPNRTLFNYLITAAAVGDKIILLDATSKNADVNVLPVRDLNSLGRLIKADGSNQEIDLMPKSNSLETINILATINAKGEISGKINHQMFDYNALVFREKNNKLSMESCVEKLEKIYRGIEVKEYEVQNNLELTLPMIQNYNFTDTNSGEIIGDKIYVTPLLFLAMTENPFKQEYRDYPIDFEFPKQKKYNITLNIPDGYALESIPQSKELSISNNLGDFNFISSNVGNTIQIKCTMNINKAIFDAGYYLSLKEFFKQVIEKQTEKIVLKKV